MVNIAIFHLIPQRNKKAPLTKEVALKMEGIIFLKNNGRFTDSLQYSNTFFSLIWNELFRSFPDSIIPNTT